MGKRIQQNSGEERVTAKSRPLMNLIARTPSVVSSSTSLSPRMDQGNLMNSLQQIIQNWIMTVLGLLKSGKLRLRRTIDQGNLLQQVRPHHGETLLDGAAQSVRNGGILRDRSGQPDNINSQEAANSQNFIMGSDVTEYVNRVNDEVRKKTEKNVQRCRRRRRAFNNLVNVYGCDDECSDIHGKEFPGQSKFHYEYNRSHPEENVRHICKIGGRTR